MPSNPDPGFVMASAFQFLAAVLAIFIARRRAQYRPVAIFFAVQVVANLVHEGLRLGVLVPARAAGDGAPFTGAVLHVWQAVTAIGLLWPAGIAAVALVVFGRRRPWAVLPVWAIVAAVLAVGYPVTRGDVLARVLFGCELAAFLTAAVSVGAWQLRRVGPAGRIEHLTTFLLVALEAGMLFVWRDQVFTGWLRAQSLQAVVYGAIGVIEGGVLWRHGSLLEED